jgi:Cu(I)/Ag(I) efflux system membrane protein CusA/SilA
VFSAKLAVLRVRPIPPLEMFETTIQFKPRDQWRPGMTPAKLVNELDRVVKVPGLSNIWVPPIRNRLDMLATGIKSPIGVKVSGASLADIDKTAQEIEQVAKAVPGVSLHSPNVSVADVTWMSISTG